MHKRGFPEFPKNLISSVSSRFISDLITALLEPTPGKITASEFLISDLFFDIQGVIPSFNYSLVNTMDIGSACINYYNFQISKI